MRERNGRPRQETAAQSIAVLQSVDADLALRCAWRRAHAGEIDACAWDPSGRLAAQLRDFADLLEVAQREGWWDQ